MFWFGLSVGVSCTFLVVWIGLVLVKTQRDPEWIKEDREFKKRLLDFHRVAHEDAEMRNHWLAIIARGI